MKVNPDQAVGLAEREIMRIFEVADTMASLGEQSNPRSFAMLVVHEHGIDEAEVARVLDWTVEDVAVVRQEVVGWVSSDPAAYQYLIRLRHEVDMVRAPALLAENERAWHALRHLERTRQRTILQAGVADRRRDPHRAGRSKTRGAAQRSSDRSGSSGDDDPDDEPGGSPPPIAGRRFCACGADISHKRADATACSPKCRVRRHRHADPTQSLNADSYYDLRPEERDALQERSLSGCRCNGHRVLDGESGDCIKCGRPYVAPYYVALWARRQAVRA